MLKMLCFGTQSGNMFQKPFKLTKCSFFEGCFHWTNRGHWFPSSHNRIRITSVFYRIQYLRESSDYLGCTDYLFHKGILSVKYDYHILQIISAPVNLFFLPTQNLLEGMPKIGINVPCPLNSPLSYLSLRGNKNAPEQRPVINFLKSRQDPLTRRLPFARGVGEGALAVVGRPCAGFYSVGSL